MFITTIVLFLEFGFHNEIVRHFNKNYDVHKNNISHIQLLEIVELLKKDLCFINDDFYNDIIDKAINISFWFNFELEYIFSYIKSSLRFKLSTTKNNIHNEISLNDMKEKMINGGYSIRNLVRDKPTLEEIKLNQVKPNNLNQIGNISQVNINNITKGNNKYKPNTISKYFIKNVVEENKDEENNKITKDRQAQIMLNTFTNTYTNTNTNNTLFNNQFNSDNLEVVLSEISEINNENNLSNSVEILDHFSNVNIYNKNANCCEMIEELRDEESYCKSNSGIEDLENKIDYDNNTKELSSMLINSQLIKEYDVMSFKDTLETYIVSFNCLINY